MGVSPSKSNYFGTVLKPMVSGVGTSKSPKNREITKHRMNTRPSLCRWRWRWNWGNWLELGKPGAELVILHLLAAALCKWNRNGLGILG